MHVWATGIRARLTGTRIQANIAESELKTVGVDAAVTFG
jgi:hypothetical protein